MNLLPRGNWWLLARMIIIDRHGLYITIVHLDNLNEGILQIYKIDSPKEIDRKVTYFKQYMASRLALAMSLERIFSRKIESPEVIKNTRTVPFLKNCNGIAISISHSGNYACALATDKYKRVGIDIEEISEKKTKNLKDYYKSDDIKEIYGKWTLMEAEFKAQVENGEAISFWDKDFFCSIVTGERKL